MATDWQGYRDKLESALAQRLPPGAESPERLHQAMRYACLDGGKRLRGMLVYTTGGLYGVNPDILDAPACAVEIVHAYSLIHDDLPAMDDDDLRRGKPACHKRFDEATAILAGDALQSLAFEILAEDPQLHSISARRRLHMLRILTKAVGHTGMAGGQAIDLQAVGKQLAKQELENMHLKKTGALIQASVLLGALCAEDASEKDLELLAEYGTQLGLVFQVVDDVLDETADTKTLGKQSGADRALNKPTYTALLGIQGARRAAQEHHAQALAPLSRFRHNTDVLAQLADFVIERTY